MNRFKNYKRYPNLNALANLYAAGAATDTPHLSSEACELFKHLERVQEQLDALKVLTSTYLDAPPSGVVDHDALERRLRMAIEDPPGAAAHARVEAEQDDQYRQDLQNRVSNLHTALETVLGAFWAYRQCANIRTWDNLIEAAKNGDKALKGGG